MNITKSSNSAGAVSSTEMARHFSDYLARVRYGDMTITITKNRTSVAELRPLPAERCTLGDFIEIWRSSKSDPDFAEDIEKAGRTGQNLRNPWG